MKHSPEIMPAPEQERIERLKKDFRSIFEGQSIDLTAVDTLFKKITERYQAEGRAYHTLEHIDHLLSFLRGRRSDVQDWRGVQLTAWFHDAVYDTKANDNEEQSAQFARHELEQLGMSNEVITHVERLVRATATHQIIEDDNDSAIFLDGDLSILGANDEEYDKYAAKIREEYSWVPEDQYRAGRKQILERFLNRPKIYFTEDAHTNLDAQARRNLKREIQQL